MDQMVRAKYQIYRACSMCAVRKVGKFRTKHAGEQSFQNLLDRQNANFAGLV